LGVVRAKVAPTATKSFPAWFTIIVPISCFIVETRPPDQNPTIMTMATQRRTDGHVDGKEVSAVLQATVGLDSYLDMRKSTS
jgi:hypothetical protein